MTALERLGAFAAGHRPDARTAAAVRLHVADTVGAFIAGAGTQEGRALAALRRPDAALADRIAINCAITRLSEVDDIHLGSMITPGAIVVPAALTIAATLPDTTKGDVAAAVVAGYETMIRFGAAIDGPSVLYRGIWPTYFTAPLGVAAVAARLLRLDEARAAQALANAFIMMTPGTGHHAAVTTLRWLAAGYAAARGWQAAEAARAGFTSDLKLPDGEFLKNVYGIVPNPTVLNDGLGEPALLRTSFKPWCAARQTMAATQALREILAHGVSANAITKIEASVLPAHLKMINHGVTPGDRFSHLTSVQYQMAVAALSPDDAYSIGGPAGPISAALQSFMAKIAVRPDDGLRSAGYPQVWAAHVAVTTPSGRHERHAVQVPGDPAAGWGEADLKAKFERVTASVLDRGRADALFVDALAALERPAEMLAALERVGGAALGLSP